MSTVATILCDGPEHCGQWNAQQHEAADDGEGVGPAEAVVQQVDDGRHEEGADAGAGLGDALREGTLLLEVGRHHDDGRQVDQAETHTCAICFISNVYLWTEAVKCVLAWT